MPQLTKYEYAEAMRGNRFVAHQTYFESPGDALYLARSVLVGKTVFLADVTWINNISGTGAMVIQNIWTPGGAHAILRQTDDRKAIFIFSGEIKQKREDKTHSFPAIACIYCDSTIVVAEE